MTFVRGITQFPQSIVAAALGNLAVVAPALAAPTFALPFDITSFGTREFLLYGSVALLVIGLIAKVIRDRHHADTPAPGPDLRWWKNPPPNPQH